MRQAGEVTYADAHKHHRGEGYVWRGHAVSLGMESCIIAI